MPESARFCPATSPVSVAPATAKAIGDMLESKGAEVHTLDVYAYISNLIKTTIDKGYLFSSKHMQTLYRLVYQLAENDRRKLF